MPLQSVTQNSNDTTTKTESSTSYVHHSQGTVANPEHSTVESSSEHQTTTIITTTTTKATASSSSTNTSSHTASATGTWRATFFCFMGPQMCTLSVISCNGYICIEAKKLYAKEEFVEFHGVYIYQNLHFIFS